MGRWIARSFSTLLTEPCVKTHTSAKCRKHNSAARHRTSLVQYDLTPTDAIAQRYFYVWPDRWSFRTAKTHSGHRPERNSAAQQSPAVLRWAIVWSEAREALTVRRRECISLLARTASGWPRSARGQPTRR